VTTPSNVTLDGNSLTISNCTITFNNAFDPTTGVASITVTPAPGGMSTLISTLPALAAGQPGPSPQFRNVNLTQVAYGTSLPTPAATATMVSPGGSGVPAIYDLNLWLNSGAPGSSGSFLIHAATDFIGTLTSRLALVVDPAGSGNITTTSMPFGLVSVPATISSTSGNGAQRTLATATFAPQPWPFYVWAGGSCIIGGTANTRVDLWASMGSAGGVQIAYADGVTGITSADPPAVLVPDLPTSLTTAKVAANTAATAYFIAQQQNGGITDNWSTTAATTRFSVMAVPVPS